jgi:hypothetical protein
VTITDVNEVPLKAGTVLSVTLQGLINSQFAAETDSFTFKV